MNTFKQGLVDLLAMGRVANLPTVVSNVMVGCVLGVIFQLGWPALAPFVPCLAGCLLYLGGCYLNDWKDAGWDAAHKPDRPLPSGRISRPAVLVLSVLLLTGGCSLSLTLGPAPAIIAALITFSVILYTLIHKKTTWSIVPMGLCRALLYLLGFTSVLYDPNDPYGLASADARNAGHHFDLFSLSTTLFLPCLGILIYIAGISLLARFEARALVPRTNRVAALFLLLLPALTHSSLHVLKNPLIAFLATLPFVASVLWANHLIRKSVGAGVSFLLAGIALLDLVIFLPIAFGDSFGVDFGAPWDSAWSWPVFSLAAFLLSLLLQRIAPAT